MSVRGERTVYRERDTEYEEPRRTTYKTVTRYKVPDNIARSVRGDDDEEVKEKIVIKRSERERDHRDESLLSPRDDVHYTVRESVRERDRSSVGREREDIDIRFTERIRERSRDPSAVRREVVYKTVERDSDYDRPRSEIRFSGRERDRDTVRAPSPPAAERVREYRFERERDFSPEREREYDVQRYSKTTEYLQPAPAPTPIVIRSAPAPAPIIIQEERREPQRILIRREEPQYEFVERREVEETKSEVRSLVKREPSPSPPPTAVPEEKPQEEYFYERRVVERRRRSHSDDRKSEIRPRDSASQYSSDDEYEYYRKEKTYDERRAHSPNHKLHLAEGAIAGIGAAEILRHHRRRKGEAAGGPVKSVIGGAAVGALGAEAISRVRSMRSLREKSRSRSRSYERGSRRDDRRRHGSRSRSRSKSKPRLNTLGGLAAVAAVGALAGYALKKSGNKETVVIEDRPHRSRSRRRRGSYDSYADGSLVDDKHRDPDHRNRRIAQAGLASAAAAGVWERFRSKSRGGRSKSRVREGVPIVAAGLGGAALAGLYEKNKANKEARRSAIIADEVGRDRHGRSRSRSRARSRSRYSGDGRRSLEDDGLVAYGRDPIHTDNRRDPGYYDDEAPGSYRRRGGSNGSSPDTRRHRSRSRARLAEAGGAAGAGAFAAHEYDRHRDRSQVRNDAYYNNNAPRGYPGSDYFAPPPTHEMPRGEPNYDAGGYPSYNPQQYAGQPAAAAPYGSGAYGESAPNLGQSYANDTFAGDARYAANANHANARGGHDPGNVSSPPVSPFSSVSRNDFSSTQQNVSSHSPFVPQRPPIPSSTAAQDVRTSESAAAVAADGLDNHHSRRHTRSPSRVRFDLESNMAISPDDSFQSLAESHWVQECSRDTDNQAHDRGERRSRHDEYTEHGRDYIANRADDRARYDDDRNDNDETHNRRDRDARRRDQQKDNRRQASHDNRSTNPAENDEETDTTYPRRHRASKSRRTSYRQDPALHDSSADSDDHPRRSAKSKGKSRAPSPHHRHDRSPSENSDSTVDLPARFDDYGNRKGVDPLAEKINDLLAGRGSTSGLLKGIAGELFGDNGRSSRAGGEDRDGRRRSSGRE